jgi:hypothetical protein
MVSTGRDLLSNILRRRLGVVAGADSPAPQLAWPLRDIILSLERRGPSGAQRPPQRPNQPSSAWLRSSQQWIPAAGSSQYQLPRPFGVQYPYLWPFLCRCLGEAVAEVFLEAV